MVKILKVKVVKKVQLLGMAKSIRESSEPKGYKILIKISKRYIKFYINQNGKIAAPTATYPTGKSKIAAEVAILQKSDFFKKMKSLPKQPISDFFKKKIN